MTYTSLITFRVAPGRNADFEAAFERTGMLTRPEAVAGFQGAALHRSLDDPDTYIVLGCWDSPAAYRRWQARSGDDAPGLPDLLDSLITLTAGQLFSTVARSRPRGDNSSVGQC